MSINEVINRVGPCWCLENSENEVKHPLVGHTDHTGSVLFALLRNRVFHANTQVNGRKPDFTRRYSA